MEMIFFSQTIKKEKILSKIFSPLNISHILLKKGYLVFWSILAGNWQKNSLLVQKMTISDRSLELIRKYFFHELKKGKSGGTIINNFFVKPEKWDK